MITVARLRDCLAGLSRDAQVLVAVSEQTELGRVTTWAEVETVYELSNNVVAVVAKARTSEPVQ